MQKLQRKRSKGRTNICKIARNCTEKKQTMGRINKGNLRTPTSEEAREMQKKAVEKRKENAKEKVLMSEIYSDFIAEHKEELEESLRKVAMRGDASTVSLISELRKGTEGDKTEITAKVATTEMSREELYNFVFGEK